MKRKNILAAIVRAATVQKRLGEQPRKSPNSGLAIGLAAELATVAAFALKLWDHRRCTAAHCRRAGRRCPVRA